MNDEEKCPNTVLYSGFLLNLYFTCDFKAWHRKFKKIEKIICRDTLCGREMITSVYILNL